MMGTELANVNVYENSPQTHPPLSDDAREEMMLFLDEFSDGQALEVQK